MGLEGAFLRKLPGLFFILIGVFSQIYIAKRIGASKEHAQNGHAEAAYVDGFLMRLTARLRALCASKEHAHNGHAEAAYVDGLLIRLTARLRALCASKEHAQNGHAEAAYVDGLLIRLTARIRALFASKPLTWTVISTYLVISLALEFELIHDPPRPINYYLDELGSAFLFYGWMADIIAVVMFLRSLAPAPFSRQRRRFLNATATAVCAAPVVALTTGMIIRKDFQVKEMDLKIPGLPKDLQGLRLLQLSDIHMGAFFSPSDLRRVVDASNHLRADLGFVTGDMITNVNDPLDDCLLELKRLKTSSGLWGCMGNHEKYAKLADYAARQGRKQGLFFLRHQAETVQFGGSRINLVGVDHQFKREGYLVGVEELVKPDEFNLLLSHNPDVFPVAEKQGFQLTLSGHTHGGQINIEVAHTNLNIVDLVTPYTKGLYQMPGSSLYVTSGLGTIGVPVRLGAPPEITLLRLCAS